MAPKVRPYGAAADTDGLYNPGSMIGTGGRTRTAQGFSLGVSLALFSALAFTFRQYTPDDTFIFLRYAENLATGQGLVYNVGERVYGITSPLWTILLAAAGAIGLDMLAFAKVAGAVFGAACIVLAQAIARRIGHSAAVLAPLVAAGFLDLPYWSISGMDTSLFAALCGLGLLLTLRAASGGSLAGAAIVWSIAALTRPEGVMFGLLAMALLFRERRPLGVRRAAVAAAIFLLPLLAWVSFAWWYYGDPVPTTYWAKRLDRWPAMHKGLILLRAFLTANDAAFIALASLAALWHSMRRPLAVLGAFVLINVAYILWTGGDSWASAGVFRFAVAWLVPLSVIMAAGLGLVFERLGALGRPALARAAAAVVIAAWLVFPSTSGLPLRAVGGDPVIIAHLNAQSAPSDLLVVHDIGQFGYLTKLRVFDIYGLVEPWVARELRKDTQNSYYPADGRRLIDRILSLEARWVILKGTADANGLSIAPESIGPALFADPRFRARYRFVLAGTSEPFLLFETRPLY